MKPVKIPQRERSNCWKPKGKVWFQKNDDSKKYSVTIKVDGRTLETKPFIAKNKEDAIQISEKRGRINFPNAEDVDAVNVEEI
jgi:hypothetical protein